MIGGEEEGCRRLIGLLGADAVPLDFELAVHCPEVSEVAEAWLELHRRPTREVAGVRFYTCDGVRSYRAGREEMPVLPPRYEEPGTVEPLLAKLVAKRPGVVALEDGRLVQRLPDGTRVQFALDPDLQQTAERLLRRYQVPYGSIVLLSVRTGRVLASNVIGITFTP